MGVPSRSAIAAVGTPSFDESALDLIVEPGIRLLTWADIIMLAPGLIASGGDQRLTSVLAG